MSDPSHWLPHSPFRKPEWRWLRATYLHETGRRLDRRVDDDWVTHARDALRGRGRGGTLAAAVRAARVVWAGDPDRRGEVEARLLAGDGDAAVADRMALPQRVVAAYSEVFFCVRPTLKATDWVLSEAVGYSPFIGFTRELPWAASRLAAVAGGPIFADLVMAATTGRPLPPAFLDPGGVDEVREKEFARLWVASMAAVTPAAFASVLREHRRFRSADARRRGRNVRVEPMVLAMETLWLSRAVAGVQAGASVAGHSHRDGPAVVTAPSSGQGGGRAGENGQARPPSAKPSRHSTRRTQAA